MSDTKSVLRRNWLLEAALAVSAGIFFLMTIQEVTMDRLKVVFLFWCAVCCGIAALRLGEKVRRTTLVEKIVGVVVAGKISYEYRDRVYEDWKDFYTIKRILGRFPFGEEQTLKAISTLAAIAAMLFVGAVTAYIINLFVQTVALIDWKKFLLEAHQEINGRTILLGIGNLLLGVGIGTILLMGVYLLPIEPINRHMKESAEQLQKEGPYPEVFSWCTSQLDNYTDALILSTAADDNTEQTLLNRAMEAYSIETEEAKDAVERMSMYYLEGKPFDYEDGYARYWHGYQIFVRPLLVLLNYHEIRILNGIVQFILCLVVCWLLKKNGKISYIVPYLIVYLMLGPVILAKSLQYSSCYYVYTMGTIMVLVLTDKKKTAKLGFCFLNIGIATAYFDLLTYPIATLGIPLLVAIVLDAASKPEEKMVHAGKNILCWGAGYAGMWSMKWGAATILTGDNVIQSAKNNAAFRMSSGYQEQKFTMLGCIEKNINNFVSTPFVIIFIVFLLFAFLWVRTHRKENLRKENLVLFLTISLFPLIWYRLLLNHSTIHGWFTYKACAVSLLAIEFMAMELIESKKTVRNDRILNPQKEP